MPVTVSISPSGTSLDSPKEPNTLNMNANSPSDTFAFLHRPLMPMPAIAGVLGITLIILASLPKAAS